MSSPSRYPVQRSTVDDYRQWQGDWELVDGIPISMAPSPFGPHERLVDDFAEQLKRQLINCREPCRVYRNLDWVVGPHDVVRPDAMIVCGAQPDEHLRTPPELCVEVLSESTRRHDLLVKRPFYRDHGVGYYLVAEPGIARLQLFINRDQREVEAIELEAGNSRELVLENGCRIVVQPLPV